MIIRTLPQREVSRPEDITHAKGCRLLLWHLLKAGVYFGVEAWTATLAKT